MKGEIPHPQESSPTPRREDFGPGNAGEAAHRYTTSGVSCNAPTDDVDKNGEVRRCGKKAVGTLDYDDPFSRNLQFSPVCSEECFASRKRELQECYDKLGRFLSTGRNGWGRC